MLIITLPGVTRSHLRLHIQPFSAKNPEFIAIIAANKDEAKPHLTIKIHKLNSKNHKYASVDIFQKLLKNKFVLRSVLKLTLKNLNVCNLNILIERLM